MHLIATQAFDRFAQGERITDERDIYRILAGHEAAFVVAVPPAPEPETAAQAPSAD